MVRGIAGVIVGYVVMALLCASVAEAQQRRITGTVAAREGGAPLTSASISVIGTTTGAYTGTDGKFSVMAPATTVSLRVRRIGFLARTVVVPVSQSDLGKEIAIQVRTQAVPTRIVKTPFYTRAKA